MASADLPRRLNFGCGYDKRAGFLNVDSDPACQPDLLLVDNDLSGLPREHFEEILALDVLEHIDRVETVPVLMEWAHMLVDGGRLEIKTSSIEGVGREVLATQSFRRHYEWTHFLFGTQAHPGDYHRTGFTDTTLRVFLAVAGFEVDRLDLEDRWLLRATARKTWAWHKLAWRPPDEPEEDFVVSVFQSALGRDPQPAEMEFLLEELASGRFDRTRVVRHLVSSPERMYHVAEQCGFDGPEAPGWRSRLLDSRVGPLVRRGSSSVRAGLARSGDRSG